ncbi:MAG: type II secretion system protein [Deltaproteobacteria bacterium]|nr:type II secretion system protein [Deltaproteobacteria bacterium]
MKRTCISTGFSLIELMIVIALISIMLAVAVPTWQKYRANTDLKTAAREVMADLSNARQQAVAENLDVYRLTFNVTGNDYALTRTDTGVALWTKSVALLGSGVVIDSVNFGGSDISLNKRGTVSNGNLVLRNSLGSRAKITVNITGRTYVEYTMQ